MPVLRRAEPSGVADAQDDADAHKYHAGRDDDPATAPAFCEFSTRALRAADDG